MINHTLAQYAFIRACIFLLNAIVPLSIAHSVYELVFWPTPWQLPVVIRIWLAAETAFYFGFQIPYVQYLQKDAIHPPLRSREERASLFGRVTANTTVVDLERHLRGWFKGAGLDGIGRDSVKSWLAWAFFEGRSDAETKGTQEVEEYAAQLEQTLGKPFLPGYGTATPIRLTLDPVVLSHRSLLWYWCVFFVDFLTFARLTFHGYHFHRLAFHSFFTLFPFRPLALTSRYCSPVKYSTYWHRPHTSKTRLPVLFIHGIGIGLYPYVDFLRDLNEHADDGDDDGQIGILAIEIMPISSRITHAALGKEDMCREIDGILTHHGVDRCVLVSHSYGSVVTTHILHSPVLQRKVSSVLLIDPVTFLLHHPTVAYNFTTRQPRYANEWLLWYFGSQDPGVAHTLGRRFFWSENALWLEDLLPRVQHDNLRVTVSLASRDSIIDTEAVGNYLAQGSAVDHAMEKCNGLPEAGDGVAWKGKSWKGKGLEVLCFEDCDHGQAFERKKMRTRLVEVVRGYCKGV